MPSSIDTQKAIKAHWDSRPALVAAVPNGIFTGRAPKGTEFPYAVHGQISNVPRSRTNKSQYVDHVFQISVFETTAEAAGEKAKIIKDNFDFQALSRTILEGKSLDFRRQSQLEAQEDDQVWMGVVSWQVLVQSPVDYQPA